MSEAAYNIDASRAEAILDARTEELARVSLRRREDAGDAREYLAVRAGEQRFALPFSMVAGVCAGRALNALPVREPAVIGALYERGEVWVAFSLGRLAGCDNAAEKDGRFILLRGAGRATALHVDALEGRTRIARGALSPLGPEDTRTAGAVVRLIGSDGMLVIDENAVLDRTNLLRRSKP